MTNLMIDALLAFFVGVIIRKYMNGPVGDVVEVVAAIFFIIAWLLGVVHA